MRDNALSVLSLFFVSGIVNRMYNIFNFDFILFLHVIGQKLLSSSVYTEELQGH